MANTIIGRVLRIGEAQTLKSLRTNNTFVKREMILDMTRHDPWTGEREAHENIVSLEFSGDKGAAMLDTIQVNQIVMVTFAVRGFPYEKDGQTRYMTKIDPYKIEPVQRQQHSQNGQGQQPAPQQQDYVQQSQAPYPPLGGEQQQTRPQESNLPF